MTNADDKMHLSHPSSPILSVGKHMKKLAVAAAVAALCGAGLSAQPTATLRAAQTPSPSAPKPAASHPSTQLGAGPSAPATSSLSIDAQNKLVAQNCASCHSERMKAGELVLAGFDAAKIAERPDVAEKMIRKLRAGMMPPPGARRPDRGDRPAFARRARNAHRRGRGAQSESRLASVPAPESRRVRSAR